MRRVSIRPERVPYPRVEAPVYHRPVTWFALGALRRLADASLGGFCTYTDEAQRPGRLLEIEVFLPSGGSATVVAEVAWVDPLPDGSPARFDVGLRYVKASTEDLERIAAVLSSA